MAAPAAASPWGSIGSALLSGGMSLLGSILGKPDAPRPSSPTGWLSGLQVNAPMFPLPSDEETKQNMSSADDDIRSFLEALHPTKYDYKDEYADGSSPNFGVIAQDLQKTDIGRDMVSEGDNGKLQVDYGPRTVEALLSIVASLGQRIEELERK